MILVTYVNKESLVSIDEEKLQNVKFDLIDIDTEIKALNLILLDSIISLRM